MMSGKKNFNEQLKEFEEVLDEYRTRLGLDNIQMSSDAIKYLSLTFGQVKGMSEEEANYASFALSQYAAYIQTEQNRHTSRVGWAEDKLGKIIAVKSQGGNNQYTKYELLKAQIIVGDSAAQALNNIILHAQARSNELDSISDKIIFMSVRMKDVKKVRDQRQC